jgi:hypothetical protein
VTHCGVWRLCSVDLWCVRVLRPEPEGVARSKYGLYGLIAAVSGGGGQARELNACVCHGIACCALCLKTQLVRVPRRKANGAAARAARVVHGAWRSWEATLTSCAAEIFE